MKRPNWKNSILNVSATLSDFLGNKNNIKKIKILKKYLNKNYDNIIYICFDGLGVYPLKQNLNKNSFLCKHIAKKITSVFPSTTTNATTTLYTAKYPSQHGLFGWSLFFKELNRCVDIYPQLDSYTCEKVESNIVKNYLTFEYFFDTNKTDYQLTTIFPSFINRKSNNITYDSIKSLFISIKNVCNNKKKNFIFSYCGEPDVTMHKFGVNSQQAKNLISFINDSLQNLSKNLSNTLIVITPDHGQTDIKDYIKLYDDKELLNSIKTPFYLEPRAVSFQVKDKTLFLKAITKYKKYSKLIRVNKLIKRNYFGPKSNKLNMLGDYILIMKDNNKQFVFSENHTLYKGHHTALSKKEMILPLIIIDKK